MLVDMSTDADPSLYLLGPQSRDEQIHNSRKETRSIQNMVMIYFQLRGPDSEEKSQNRSTEKRSLLQCRWTFSHCRTRFQVVDCFYYSGPCQGERPSLTEKDIKRGNKARELDELR